MNKLELINEILTQNKVLNCDKEIYSKIIEVSFSYEMMPIETLCKDYLNIKVFDFLVDFENMKYCLLDFCYNGKKVYEKIEKRDGFFEIIFNESFIDEALDEIEA